MQPLRRTKQKNQNTTYLIILVLLVLFFATVGLKFIINTSLFVSELSQKPNRVTKDDVILIAPELFNLPDATNSAQIAISGSAMSVKTAKIFVNGEEQKDIQVEDDQFETDIDLKKGENTLYIRVKDPITKKVKDSEVYKVMYISEKPELSIESPQDNSTVNTNEITVKGSTDKDKNVTVKVNNGPTVLDSEGVFSTSVRLKEGDNTIVVTATDNAGNADSKELHIKYDKES